MRPIRLCLALALGLIAFAAGAEDGYVPLEQRLSSEQMQATGLSGLSAEQLARLNAILRDDTATQVKRARAADAGLPAERAPPPEPISATIVGAFRGWSKGQVLTLDNGQQWQVVDGDLYTGKAIDAAKASITPGMLGSWYLRVEGQTPQAKVKRIK